MELQEYFDTTRGRGVLATSGAQGIVNAAVYARPHFFDKQTVAFIMADRLTHKNVNENNHAVYLFIEDGKGYNGKRLYLTRTKEVEDDNLIAEICRRCDYSYYRKEITRYVVYFQIDKVLPLIGEGEV